MKIKIYLICLFIVLYVAAIIFAFSYSINYPDDHSNVFAFINGLVANLSAIFLGFLAIYQSQKYKKENDEKDATPILMLAPSIDYFDISLSDIICQQMENSSERINIIVCSLNKAVSNFQVNEIIFKKNGKIISKQSSCNHSSGQDSIYNGIFLPESFYKITLNVLKPCQNGELYIKFIFNNIYYENYQKEIVLSSDGDEWKLSKVSKCIKII